MDEFEPKYNQSEKKLEQPVAPETEDEKNTSYQEKMNALLANHDRNSDSQEYYNQSKERHLARKDLEHEGVDPYEKDQLEDKINDLQGSVDELSAKIAELKNELDARKKQIDRAENEGVDKLSNPLTERGVHNLKINLNEEIDYLGKKKVDSEAKEIQASQELSDLRERKPALDSKIDSFNQAEEKSIELEDKPEVREKLHEDATKINEVMGLFSDMEDALTEVDPEITSESLNNDQDLVKLIADKILESDTSNETINLELLESNRKNLKWSIFGYADKRKKLDSEITSLEDQITLKNNQRDKYELAKDKYAKLADREKELDEYIIDNLPASALNSEINNLDFKERILKKLDLVNEDSRRN